MKNNNKPILTTTTKDGALFVNAIDLYNALAINAWYTDWLKQLTTDYWLDPDFELYTDEDGIEWIRASFAKGLCSVLGTRTSRRVREYIHAIMECQNCALAETLAAALYQSDVLSEENENLKREIMAIKPKAEYFIPLVVNNLTTTDKATCEVLDTTAKWFGVTYAADRPATVEKIQSLVDAGEYPEKLF
jgi:hypothetical protein